MKKIISIFMVLALVFCCAGCSGTTTKQERFTTSFLDLFDTASTIIAYDDSQESFDEHYQQFHDKLEEYDHLYDIYNSYEGVNNMYFVNRHAAEAPVKVDKAIIELLEYCKQVYKMSDGRTNICFGSVLALWHAERTIATDNPTLAKLPDMAQLKEANKHTSIDDLVINAEDSTVYFKDKDMQLDVGAVAKGFAVQQVMEWANENLWQNVAVSIGGNVSTYGVNGQKDKKWVIGIENPDRTSTEYLDTVGITDLCVVTSGDYQRYYTVDGKKYCHIINPQTLMPSEYVSAVSILCTDSALGDALSTTLFNMSIEDGKAMVESLDGVEAVWVDKEFNKTYSSGFEEYICE